MQLLNEPSERAYLEFVHVPIKLNLIYFISGELQQDTRVQGRSQVFIGGGASGGNINLSIETFLQNREKLYC